MNDVWNLDPIYKGFDDPAFATDMAARPRLLTISFTLVLSHGSSRL